MIPARLCNHTCALRNDGCDCLIQSVQRGETALVENHGEPEVAIIDIVDYRLLRAAMRFLARRSADRLWTRPASKPDEGGLSQEDVDALAEVQDRYDLVLASYLEGEISLARTAELLGMSWIELHTRFWRLDIPMETAPADLEEARRDTETAVRLAEPDR